MFRLSASPSYKTPGLRWKEKADGSVVGRLYTTWPLRFRTRFTPVKRIGIASGVVLGLYALAIGSIPNAIMVFCSCVILVVFYGYPALLIWPFWPLSKRIAINHEHLSIGFKKYRLEDTGPMQPHATGPQDQGPYALIMPYANKFITINVKNPGDQTLNIAEAINEARAYFLGHRQAAQHHGALDAQNGRQNGRQNDRVSAF